jgi:hypothetical protein
MVQVQGATYRVVRESLGFYEVVRLLDDVKVGTFRTIPPMEMKPIGIDSDLLREIAKMALQGAKLSWVGRVKQDD